MRIVKNPQMQLGEVDISEIKFHPKSRDDIPQILKGLQFIYTHLPTREAVFKILEKNISPKINKNNGRPGMELWKIFVMGVLRLDLNLDYDRLEHCVNYDLLIRQMLGHGVFDQEGDYQLQTIKDNVMLLTPEVLDEINQVVIKAGHTLLKKKKTICCMAAVIHLLLKQMFISQRISIYYLMPCVRLSPYVLIFMTLKI